jgi:6-pyruvoyltetrahydropterin/6-carboxytetrahydropterin synthase
MQVYKEFTFEAAHFLPSAPKGHPNSRLHGHSFQVRVSVEGQPDPATGLLIHFWELAEAMKEVQEALDHRNLNEDIEGLDAPTLENLSVWIWNRLSAKINGLSEVHIWRPTCHEGCIYRGT